ncbi:hypothetical protein CSUI_005655, partial [Cystoisospora suis]
EKEVLGSQEVPLNDECEEENEEEKEQGNVEEEEETEKIEGDPPKEAVGGGGGEEEVLAEEGGGTVADLHPRSVDWLYRRRFLAIQDPFESHRTLG